MGTVELHTLQQANQMRKNYKTRIRQTPLHTVPEEEAFHQENSSIIFWTVNNEGTFPFLQQNANHLVTSAAISMTSHSTDLRNTSETNCFHNGSNVDHRNGTGIKGPTLFISSQTSPGPISDNMYRRHTLAALQYDCSLGTDIAPDDESALSRGYITPRKKLQDGAISQEEAEQKRFSFLHYLEQCYPNHASAISQKVSTKNSPLAQIRNRASFVADNSYHSFRSSSHSPQDIEWPKYGSLSRGGRLRSSLPIVRSRSRSRERPLGIVYLEYSGESRTAVLPNELTSLDTIRALFVQAYPGLLTMPMLNPQHHTLLLKNKKNQNFDEISNIGHIKDRSTIRARPTGIPMPGSKKPPVHQKPKISSEKKNSNVAKAQKTIDLGVAENNKKNSQKSGLKPPVKSMVRQCQPGSNLSKPVSSSDASDVANTCSQAVKKSLKSKAPPPPPRKPKPTNLVGLQKNSAPTPSNVASINENLRSGNGLGGGSFPQKGFAYVPTMFNEASVNGESNEQSVHKQENLSNFTASVTSNNDASGRVSHSDEVSRGLHDNDQTTNKFSNPSPRTYAGSPMASQTQFSSSSSLQGDQTISKLLKNKGLENRAKSAGQLSKVANSTDSARPVSNPAKRDEDDSGALQPSSFERRELVQTSSSPSLFPRTSRSFRGNQPKPFSIPIVPDLTSSCATNQPSSSPEPSRASSATSYSSPMTSRATSNHSTERLISNNELTQKKRDKNVNNNNSSNKKNLFGLKKHITNKPVGGSGNQQSGINEKSKNPEHHVSSRGSPDGARVTSPASCHSSSSSISSNQPPKLPVKVGSQNQTSGRKAALPRTDLLNSLLSHKAEKADNEIEDGKDNSVSASSSDLDKDSFQGSSNGPVRTGVLKHGNLIKSASSSSILTDSGASNLSATPSMKIKKVSFQDNVTVCDVNGISTFSNSLRHPDFDDEAYVSARTVDGQSLSHDETDSGNYVNSDSPIKSWGEDSVDYNAINATRKTMNNFNQNRVRPVTPRSELTTVSPYSAGYLQHAGSDSVYPASNYAAHASRQSAVAAAIQSISSKPTAETYDRSTMTHAHLKASLSNYDQFAVSCASPVPFVTRQERNEPSYKEDWDPYRRRTHSEVAPALQSGTHAHARSCVTPNFNNVTQASSQVEIAKDIEPSYFQTENSSVPVKDSFDSETPPYYECCSSSVTTQQQTPIIENEHTLSLRETTQHFQTTQAVAADASMNKSFKSFSNKNTYDQPGKSRMVAVENEIANLNGTLQSMMTANDCVAATSCDESLQQSNQIDGVKQLNTRQQLLKLRATAQALKKELEELKKQQRLNMEHVNDLLNENSRNVARLVSVTAGAQHRPLRLRRLRLDQERHAYGMTASLTEKQLSDVEAAVEELRNEVVERRCRVNAREVEALVLQLSEAGRTIAQIKGTFPSLCDELRTVAAAETEVIYAEEKFVEAEPLRLDEQLKRCKQLTATLFTLKKLANVQEARNKTPTSCAQLRPTTPSHLGVLGSRNDPHLNRNNLLKDVTRIRVDHRQRMESLQEAEINWKRRRKFILEHDSKKLEKALEMAEKALNRTDYITKINQRQQAQLKEIYKNKEANKKSNLTTSNSSSIESLPPHPAPKENINHHNSSKVPLPSGHTFAVPTSVMRLPSSDFKFSKSSGKIGYGAISPDVAYAVSENPSNTGRIILPPESTGSLPRYATSSVYRSGYGANPNSAKSYPNFDGFHQRGKPMERSRSVTPQHWTSGGLEVSHFQGDFQTTHVTNNDERQHALEQQQIGHVEKNKKLKEQYSKLQLLQKRQRLSMKKNAASQNKSHHPGFYQHSSSVVTGAKSSDV